MASSIVIGVVAILAGLAQIVWRDAVAEISNRRLPPRLRSERLGSVTAVATGVAFVGFGGYLVWRAVTEPDAGYDGPAWFLLVWIAVAALVALGFAREARRERRRH